MGSCASLRGLGRAPARGGELGLRPQGGQCLIRATWSPLGARCGGQVCKAGWAVSSLSSLGSVIPAIVCIDFHCTVYSMLNLPPRKAPRAERRPHSQGPAKPRGRPDGSRAATGTGPESPRPLLWEPGRQGWGGDRPGVSRCQAHGRRPRRPGKRLQLIVLLRGDWGGSGLSRGVARTGSGASEGSRARGGNYV